MQNRYYLSCVAIAATLVFSASSARSQSPSDAADPVLAPGKPPLTQTMVDHRIEVLEAFLEVHLTPEEKQRFEQATIAAWRKPDENIIKYTLDDLNYYGKAAELQAVRASNLESYVENMRKKPNEPLNAVLLEAFDAAHPEHRDIMRARGLGSLVGKWERGDGMAPQRNPVTGQPSGVSFTDALVLSIFSDGRFQHLWEHSHCTAGRCCHQYGTSVAGEVVVQGSTLTLKADPGKIYSHDPCIPANNFFKPLPPTPESFQWTLRMDPNSNAPALCLSDKPFQVEKKGKPQPFCYLKQP